MASMPASAPSPKKNDPQTPTPAEPVCARDAKTRAQRFEEAHAWVLENHAETFKKLAT
jgi:hypothetical protein